MYIQVKRTVRCTLQVVVAVAIVNSFQHHRAFYVDFVKSELLKTVLVAIYVEKSKQSEAKKPKDSE